MRLLTDTHALIWALGEPSKLPRRVEDKLRDPAVLVYVSAANTWEIAIKSALGKIDADLGEVVEAVRELGFIELAVTMEHCRRLEQLPSLHRDPFDRILVAQALDEGLTLVTHDDVLEDYPAPVLWG